MEKKLACWKLTKGSQVSDAFFYVPKNIPSTVVNLQAIRLCGKRFSMAFITSETVRLVRRKHVASACGRGDRPLYWAHLLILPLMLD
jgi:hypothetical protein